MEIRELIKVSLQKSFVKLSLEIDNINIERPSDSVNGDYSTNIALIVAKKLSKSPKECAEEIVKNLEMNEYFEKTEVAGPGFINFYLSKEYLQKQVTEIIKQADQYGSIDIGRGQKASVEYVSANPTGPLHIGNARGGPIGDVMANVLEKAGYKVTREYLHNNVGGQVNKLGEAIYYQLHSDQKPEEEISYQGEYIKDLAVQVKNKLGSDSKELNKEEFSKQAGEIAVEILLKEIIDDAKAMGIRFDRIVVESELKKNAPEVIKALKDTKEKDGALWFAPNDEFLKDRETVLKKSDGEYTYFASDIVYHKQKCEENDLVIDVLGANHSGHLPRLKAAVKALGFNPDKLSVILYQYVRIKRGQEVLKMSKRAGNFITAREVLDEVGKDAFRFFLLTHKPQSHMDFDLELAKKKANDNPVFYVQYAYSRICSIFKKAEEIDLEKVDLSLLKEKEELALIRHLLKLSDIVKEVISTQAMNAFTSYAIEIASLFHSFYEAHQVLNQNELTRPRLALLKATQIALRNTLSILGVEAPEHM